ncbi:fimbrial protein, partial [Serratia marcescens]|uniref:fimbrial protein n=1 Tax=Serratia marcescens TaxID=615 RepID=UPI0021CD17EE
MNMRLKPALILTSLLALNSNNIFAAEDNAGTIHFTGEIIEPSCVIHGDNGTDSTIPLGTYPTSLFTKIGDESDLTPFTIQLDDCPVATSGLLNVQLTFTGPTTLTGVNNLLDVSAITNGGATAATGVGIAVSPAGQTNLLTFDGAEGQIYIGLPVKADDSIQADFVARYK